MTDFQILHEQADFLIINKTDQASFHNELKTLGLFAQIKNQVGFDLWPVHRLDKLTTGLIIFAKSQQSANKFGQLFEQKDIQKTYIALSDKKPKKKQATIIGDMKKSRLGSWKLCHTKQNPAKTQIKSYSLVPGIRLFWIIPTTGKTHQIRVALKSLGSPILGDKRYTGTNADRGYLHAYRLRFNWNGQIIDICSKPTTGEYFLLSELSPLIEKVASQTL